jgi:regulator of extracellular matrix RemA (YlzA/DUF370 family)
MPRRLLAADEGTDAVAESTGVSANRAVEIVFGQVDPTSRVTSRARRGGLLETDALFLQHPAAVLLTDVPGVMPAVLVNHNGVRLVS